MIVFGSDYRTRRGHVAIGRSAQTLLEGGPAAVALAPADYAAIADPDDRHGRRALAARPTRPRSRPRSPSPSGSTPPSSTRDRGVDLLVVGSRAGGPRPVA